MAYQRAHRRQNYEPAMEFSEIAQRLGMKTSTVQLTYVVAMGKLMKDTEAMRRLKLMRDLVEFRESLRSRVSVHLATAALPPCPELAAQN